MAHLGHVAVPSLRHREEHLRCSLVRRAGPMLPVAPLLIHQHWLHVRAACGPAGTAAAAAGRADPVASAVVCTGHRVRPLGGHVNLLGGGHGRLRGRAHARHVLGQELLVTHGPAVERAGPVRVRGAVGPRVVADALAVGVATVHGVVWLEGHRGVAVRVDGVRHRHTARLLLLLLLLGAWSTPGRGG